MSKLDINILFSKFIINYLLLKEEIKLRNKVLFNISFKKKDKLFVIKIYFCFKRFNKLLKKLNTNILFLIFAIELLLLEEEIKLRDNILFNIRFQKREDRI